MVTVKLSPSASVIDKGILTLPPSLTEPFAAKLICGTELGGVMVTPMLEEVVDCVLSSVATAVKL